jgi:hypothetical protein
VGIDFFKPYRLSAPSNSPMAQASACLTWRGADNDSHRALGSRGPLKNVEKYGIASQPDARSARREMVKTPTERKPNTTALPSAPVVSTRRRRRWLLSAAAAFAVVVALAAMPSVLSSRHQDNDYGPFALPSNKWRPGDGVLDVLYTGPFHATRRDGQVCAWIGDEGPVAELWPAGWQVRFNPTELIAPDGTVFAHEGDVINAGGGGNTDLGSFPKACRAGLSFGNSLVDIQHGPGGPPPDRQ